MSGSILLFAFLIPGMIFSYTLSSSSYYVSQGQYLNYVYYFNMTWENTSFVMHVLSNFTTEVPPLPPYHNTSTFTVNNVLTYYDIYYSPYYLPIISLFSNFSLTNYPINNGSVTIPAIKFFTPGGSYMIVSAQYGFPISVYNETFQKGVKFNFSVTLNFVKPLPSFVKSSKLYVLNLTYSFHGKKLYETVYVVSPSATFSYYNTKLSNFSVSALNISANGYATVILPISEFPFVEPSGNIYVNNTLYTIIVQQSSEYGMFYYSTTYEYNEKIGKPFPFMGAMIGHYYVLFFPLGGDISIIFANYNQGEIVGINSAQSSTLMSFTNVALIGFIVVIIVVIAIVLKKLRH